jgi:hypothetical protein
MLPKCSCLKGGASISLRYPLADARSSRDVDSLINISDERFLEEFRSLLATGWQGFTGDIDIEDRRRLPAGVGLHPYQVVLYYRGKRWCHFSLETSPDKSGCLPSSRPALSSDMHDALEELGFSPVEPLMVDPVSQLADKLHGLSDPDKRRGRDLADIVVLLKYDTPSLDDLRTRVRQVEQIEGRHCVHMLDNRRMDEYREQFNHTRTSISFEEAWAISQRLLEQVDERHRDAWREYWNRKSQLEHRKTLLPEEIDELNALRRQKAKTVDAHVPQTRDSHGRFSHNS